jgi:hypothetical protein
MPILELIFLIDFADQLDKRLAFRVEFLDTLPSGLLVFLFLLLQKFIECFQLSHFLESVDEFSGATFDLGTKFIVLSDLGGHIGDCFTNQVLDCDNDVLNQNDK